MTIAPRAQYTESSPLHSFPLRPRQADGLKVERLRPEDEDLALSFLSSRPAQTVCMAGLIHENGIESTFNRGTFYACRNPTGELEGVSLVGHATLFEARSERALTALAEQARGCGPLYMILGEEGDVEKFWRVYSGGGQSPRRVCRMTLFEYRLPAGSGEPVTDLRRATPDDLELILPVNAEIIKADHGASPLESDPDGFRRRVARQLSQGKTVLCTEGGELLFKADIAFHTPAASYIEGVYVHPSRRGTGYSSSCLRRVAAHLAGTTELLTGLANRDDARAQGFYLKTGYQPLSDFAAYFLPRR